jgi:hypothetical protein
MGAAKREQRHVRIAVTTYVPPHVRANSAARGEVLGVLGQAAHRPALAVGCSARSGNVWSDAAAPELSHFTVSATWSHACLIS